MDLVVSGLGSFTAPSLGAFLFDLSYDPAVVSADFISFGSLLNLGGFGSIQYSDPSSPGIIHLDEISLEFSDDLDSAQPDSFTLATLNFIGLSPGISAVQFSVAQLSDALGSTLTDFSISDASIRVNRPTAVSEGGSTLSLLLVAGLLFACTIHYRVEVFEKPDTNTVTSLLCRVTTGDFEGTHNVWFGHGVVAFRDRGVHHFAQPVIARRPFIANTKFDFNQPLFAMQLAVTDLRGMIVHRRVEQGERSKFEGSPDLSRYLPLKVRYTAIVVAKGAEFQKPAWW